MSGVHDDLARVEEALPGADLEAQRALNRVQAELSRLREERDMARAGRDQWERDAKGRGVVQYELLARAQAAETELATATTTAENARLREERDAALRDVRTRTVQLGASEIRTWNAEARCVRLQQALGAYRSALRSGEPESEQLRAMGDEALAGLDTPADSQPEDGTA